MRRKNLKIGRNEPKKYSKRVSFEVEIRCTVLCGNVVHDSFTLPVNGNEHHTVFPNLDKLVTTSRLDKFDIEAHR